MRPAAPVSVPEVTPSALAGLLALGSVLPVATRSFQAATGGGAFLVAWFAALALALLATMRRRMPSVRHPVAGVAWQAAGAFGAALILRHTADVLALCAAEAPWSAGPVLGLDLGAWTVLGALVALCLPAGLLHVLRTRRPGLLLFAALGFVLALAPVVLAGPDFDRLPSKLTGSWTSAVPLTAALAWTAALVGPAALPLRAERSLAHRAVPRFVLAAATVGMPAALLAVGGLRSATAALGPAGRAAWGGFGTRIGAGFEAGACLLVALVIVVLSARVSARWMPRLRSGTVPLIALVAGLLAGWLPLATLIPAAAVAGWIAIALGPEAAPWVPAGQENIAP